MIPSLIVIVVPEEFVIPPVLLPENANPSAIVTGLFGSERSPRKVVVPVIKRVPEIIESSRMVKEPVLLSKIPRMLMLSAFDESPSVTF